MRNIYAFFLYDDQGTDKKFGKPDDTGNIIQSKDTTAIVLYDDHADQFVLITNRDSVKSKDTFNALNDLSYRIVPNGKREKILEKFKLFDFDNPIAIHAYPLDIRENLLNRVEHLVLDDVKVIDPFKSTVFQRLLSKEEIAEFDDVFDLDNFATSTRTQVETKEGITNISLIVVDVTQINNFNNILTKVVYEPFAILNAANMDSDTHNTIKSLNGSVNFDIMRFLIYWEPDTLGDLEAMLLDEFV